MSDELPAPPSTWQRLLLGALLRKLVTIAGTVLVTRGFVDQHTVDGVIPMVVEQLVGVALIGLGGLLTFLRAKVTHTRLARAWAVLTRDEPASNPASPQAGETT